MNRHKHDQTKIPQIGTKVLISTDSPQATITKVIGFNPAYDAWISRADWDGRAVQLSVYFHGRLGWADRASKITN